MRIMISVMVIIDDMRIHCNLLASPNSISKDSADELFSYRRKS